MTDFKYLLKNRFRFLLIVLLRWLSFWMELLDCVVGILSFGFIYTEWATEFTIYLEMLSLNWYVRPPNALYPKITKPFRVRVSTKIAFICTTVLMVTLMTRFFR